MYLCLLSPMLISPYVRRRLLWNWDITILLSLTNYVITSMISLPYDRVLLIENSKIILSRLQLNLSPMWGRCPSFSQLCPGQEKGLPTQYKRPTHPPPMDHFDDRHIYGQQRRSTTKYGRLWRENQSIIDDNANARLSLDTFLFVGHVLRTLTHKAYFGAHYAFESFYYMSLLSNHKTINKSLCMLLFLFFLLS